MLDYKVESFLVFAKTKNFTKAAKQLNMSQPGLSRQIQSLEEELGYLLYRRGIDRFELTEAGKIFQRYASAGAALDARFHDEIRQQKRAIVIGYDPAFQNLKILKSIAKVALMHQKFQIVLKDLPSSELDYQLQEGLIDLALFKERLSDDISYVHLQDDPFQFVMKKDVLTPEDHTLCCLEPHRQIIDLPISLAVNSLPLLLSLLDEGYVGVVPSSVDLDCSKYKTCAMNKKASVLSMYAAKGLLLEEETFQEIIFKLPSMRQTSFDMNQSASMNAAYILDVAALEKRFDILLSLLSEEEIRRVTRMMKRQDQLLELGKYLLIHSYLGDQPLHFKENGKPYLEDGPHFSISHCFPYCVLFILNHPCGVDIEIADEKRFEFLANFFDMKLEQGDFNLIERWNIKESCYKASGVGYMDARQPLMEIDDSHVSFQDNRYCYQLFSAEDASIAFASPFDFDVPAIIEVNPKRYFE